MRSLRAFLWIFLGAGSIATAQEGPAFPDATNESDHFWFNLPAGYTVADAATLGEQFDRIFEIVADRVDASLDQKITLVFDYPRPGHCPSRAWTTASRDSLPMIFVFASEDTPAAQIKGALAHEVGHVLDEAAIASRRELAIIREGFATWAAGPYWLEWKGVRSFRSAIASYKAAGMYLPLHENDGFLDTLSEDAAQRFGEDCLYYRDLIYTEWGAFIEYLVEEYGREKLYTLFRTPPLINEGENVGRPNFAAVYGRSLRELEAAWLERIEDGE